MKSIIVAAVLGLAAMPASAQQTGTQQQGSGKQAQSSMDAKSAPAQMKLRQSLEQAGFKDVKIVDAAYMVHARTSDGTFATLYIDPPAAPSGTTGARAGAPLAMTKAQLKSSLEKAGFKEVNIVDAAYQVNAQTSDGGRATMYIDPTGGSAQGSSPSAQGSSPTGSNPKK
jgi:hypothetical protein